MSEKWCEESRVRKRRQQHNIINNMKNTAEKVIKRIRRHRRIRAQMSGTLEKPRLAFFRSNKHVYAQIIDDTAGKTVIGLSSILSDNKGAVANAEQLGTDIAKKAAEKKITKVVFDRGGFTYTGSVKSFADAARKGGLKF